MNKDHFHKLIFNPIGMIDEEIINQATENKKLYDVLGGENGIVGPKNRHKDISYQAKLCRYIFVLYDKNTPLWQTHPDIISRKKEAASLAGFDIINQTDTLDKVYKLDDIFLTKSVTSFIKYQYSYELAALIANEQVLFDIQESLMEHMDDFKDDKDKVSHYKTKIELAQKQDSLLEMNAKYRDLIWKEDDSAYEKTMELEYGRAVFPEQIAKIELKKPRILE